MVVQIPHVQMFGCNMCDCQKKTKDNASPNRLTYEVCRIEGYKKVHCQDDSNWALLELATLVPTLGFNQSKSRPAPKRPLALISSAGSLEPSFVLKRFRHMEASQWVMAG